MHTEYTPNQIVVAYFKVAMPNHRYEMVPHTGVVKSVARKTCKVEINGCVYQVRHENMRAVDYDAN